MHTLTFLLNVVTSVLKLVCKILKIIFILYILETLPFLDHLTSTVISLLPYSPPQTKSKERLAFELSSNILMTYYHYEAWWQGGDSKLLCLHMTQMESKTTLRLFWATVFQPSFKSIFSN